MRLVIFGPPGSGKGTYASRIMQPLGVVKISTGDIFREERDKGTELGKTVEPFMRKGDLVPDTIVIGVLKKRLVEPDTARGFILDGYPRTVTQAQALDAMTEVDAVINLLLPEEILVEKLSARRVCQRCGSLYNIADINKVMRGVRYVLPPMLPRKPRVCDRCGGELIQRDDDKPSVISDRLRVYERQSKPVIEYYRGRIPFVDVHVDRPPDEVAQRILEKLRELALGRSP